MIKETLEVKINKVLDLGFNIDLEAPKDPAWGDFSINAAMRLASGEKTNPRKVAESLVEKLEKIEGIKSVSVDGPGFINLKIDNHVFIEEINKSIKIETYGSSKRLEGKKYLVEHSSHNPNKALHLGHLKNTLTGIAIVNLLRSQGADVTVDLINNNRGIAIARLMWGYLEFAKKEENLPTDLIYWYENQDRWHTPESMGMSEGKFMDLIYSKATEPFKNDPAVEAEVRNMVVEWEAKEVRNRALWSLTQSWVWEGYRKVLKSMNAWQVDHMWNEHEIYEKGKEHVQRGVDEGIFKQLDDGAVVTDLKKDFNLPDTILIKRDGTSLYITQDLELTHLKREKFNPDEMIWIIGPEQSLAMKQMFACCSQLGFGNFEDFKHIPYGFVMAEGANGKAVKMSSRAGTSIHVEDLSEEAKTKIADIVSSESLSPQEVSEVIDVVSDSAIKYSLLRIDRNQDMIFNFDKSISFEGNSGPYIIYTYARINKLVSSSDLKEVDITFVNEFQLDLIKLLLDYPSVVEKASVTFMPNYIASYLYDLSKQLNIFYENTKVIGHESESELLFLLNFAAKVISNALGLLQIEVVEKM